MKFTRLYGALTTVALLSGCHSTPDETCAPPPDCAATQSVPAWPAAGEIYPETSLSPGVPEPTRHDPSPEQWPPASGYPEHAMPAEQPGALFESDMPPLAPAASMEDAPGFPDYETEPQR